MRNNVNDVHRAVRSYLATAATPFCQKIQQCIQEERWDDIMKMKVSPRDYTSAEAYLMDAQAIAFFSKNVSYKLTTDRAAVAQLHWWEAERRCAATNALIRRALDGPHDRYSLGLGKFLSQVKKRVGWWLGPIPNVLFGRFGPGVTLCCRGSLSTVPDKITATPSCTSSLVPYLRWWEQSSWARSRDERGLLYKDSGEFQLDIRRESVWSSVPKNASTNRSIEIGPSLNVYHQLFIGKTMKSRFRDKGWNLAHSEHLHRRVACEASISGLRATIDLKQASDSVARLLVKACLPSQWHELLSDLRVASIKMPDGKSVFLEKFSGMGNGFTFELESVIFMAICQEILTDLGLPCLANSDVFVYGDDIIVPTEAAQHVMNALRLLGFEMNVNKTFVDGPFRESCGGDFFNGVAVRPFYLEEFPDEPQKLIVLANGLRRVAQSHPHGFCRRDTFWIPWLRVLDAIPSDIRECRGPEILGDLVIHDEPERWNTRTRHSIRYIRCWRPVSKKTSFRRGGALIGWEEFWQSVQLASRLLLRDSPLGVLPRGAVSGFKFGWVPYS